MKWGVVGWVGGGVDGVEVSGESMATGYHLVNTLPG